MQGREYPICGPLELHSVAAARLRLPGDAGLTGWSLIPPDGVPLSFTFS
jgi:hypothetical protein